MGTDSIFLFKDEVWKYGTKLEKTVRYSRIFLKTNGFNYFVQYSGLLHKCLQEEKRKIGNYPLLPENLKRTVRLSRPPGNKIDR